MAASYSKVLRDSLRVAIASASDSRVASRLTATMRAIVGLDDTNDRCQRVFDSSNSTPLLGFNFNAKAGADGPDLLSVWLALVGGWVQLEATGPNV